MTMLHADDIVIIVKNLEEFKIYIRHGKIFQKVNIEKKKIMRSATNEGPAFASGKYPCGVGRKGIGVNSVYCSFCRCWMDKKCSGLKARLVDTPNFKCNKHLPLPERNNTHKIKLGNIEYKIVYISPAILETC